MRRAEEDSMSCRTGDALWRAPKSESLRDFLTSRCHVGICHLGLIPKQKRSNSTLEAQACRTRQYNSLINLHLHNAELWVCAHQTNHQGFLNLPCVRDSVMHFAPLRSTSTASPVLRLRMRGMVRRECAWVTSRNHVVQR